MNPLYVRMLTQNLYNLPYVVTRHLYARYFIIMTTFRELQRSITRIYVSFNHMDVEYKAHVKCYFKYFLCRCSHCYFLVFMLRIVKNKVWPNVILISGQWTRHIYPMFDQCRPTVYDEVLKKTNHCVIVSCLPDIRSVINLLRALSE